MSTTYIPRNKKKVAKTPWSYDDGGFDANVDGGQWLGKLHEYLQLGIAKRDHVEAQPRVPWTATAAQCRAWAERLTVAIKIFRIDGAGYPGPHFIVAWRDFLKTCGGYST